ncbi:MAG TPA: PIN domain-containing protein [Candidatus Dojkabacteria bacterium]|nr:PIN domain-containing protein [Candidatus Dojkabacteria bacterium]
MRKIVCIDSNIFIWGVKQKCAPGQENKIPRAKNFLNWLDYKEYDILLPSPMLAEILSPVPLDEHANIMSIITKRFLIVPFDAIAAKKCAELLYASFNEPELVRYRLENEIPKQKMKYDCMIASICIVRKIEAIYSDDKDIKRFCKDEILVKGLPDIQPPLKQTDLFS